MDYSSVIEKVKASVALIIVPETPENPGGSSGTGFIFKKNGLIVTCNHVIKHHANNNVFVRFSDSETFFSAKVVITDEEHDLALLTIEDRARTPLRPAVNESIKEGIPVLMPGYPLSTTFVAHQGILSGITKDATGLTTYVIDGTVNPGNSGGPLMDKDGNIIGVVNATRREGLETINNVRKMKTGAISLHGIDLVTIYQALISNLQLGLGYAVPVAYIPDHKKADSPSLIRGKKKQ